MNKSMFIIIGYTCNWGGRKAGQPNDISSVGVSKQPLFHMLDTWAPPLPGYEEPSSTIHHLHHGVRVPRPLSLLPAATAMAEQVGVLVVKMFFGCCLMYLNV